MNLLVYHGSCYYYHQRHLLIRATVTFWRSYSDRIINSLAGREVDLAGDGRHDSMGHSAKFCTYSIFCCTVGLIIDVALVQVMFHFSLLQCRSEISEQRRRKMNACDTRIRVFFDASKIAYRIRVCAFVIHNHNFAFPVLFAEQKNKLRDCRQVENLHRVCGFDYCQFRSANAADESIHRALFQSLIPFTCNKGLERRAKLNQQIMTRKTEDMIFFSVCRDAVFTVTSR